MASNGGQSGDSYGGRHTMVLALVGAVAAFAAAMAVLIRTTGSLIP